MTAADLLWNPRMCDGYLRTYADALPLSGLGPWPGEVLLEFATRDAQALAAIEAELESRSVPLL